MNTNRMSSANTNNTTSNASRTERRLRNRSKGHVDGKALHLAMKRDSREQKFGAFERNARIISKAIKARQTKQWVIIEGDLTLDRDWNDVVWIEDFKSTLATPSREYIDTRTAAQEWKDHEMGKEWVHLVVNGRCR